MKLLILNKNMEAYLICTTSLFLPYPVTMLSKVTQIGGQLHNLQNDLKLSIMSEGFVT